MILRSSVALYLLLVLASPRLEAATSPLGVESQEPEAARTSERASSADGEREGYPDADTGTGADADARTEEPADETWYERVVVTATRSDHRMGEIPLHVTVIDQQQIELAPETALRELFLRVPSINMTSEESSLQASLRDNGLAFRGMGGIAQSRSLVLVDGLPVNDPFGGWVLFPRIPKDQVERIEVVPGANGAWGNLALSGVVNLITVAPTDRSVRGELQVGELDTRDGSLSYSDLGETWSGSISGNAFDSDGYFALGDQPRAPLDIENTTRYQTFTGKLSHSFSAAAALHLGAVSYDEDRTQGTPIAAANSTEVASSATLDLVASGGSGWQIRLFHRDVGLEELDNLADAGRTTEILSATLEVPTDSLGLGAVWTSSGRGNHSLTSGADFYYTESEATTHFNPSPAGFRQRVVAEGEQQFAGIFGQDLYSPTERLRLLFGARFDLLSTLDGRQIDTDLVTGQSTETVLIDRNTESTINPSFGAVYEASASTRLRSSVYTGFRGPVAAELFVTAPGRNKNNANPRLEPERMLGGELGVDFTPSRRWTTRATGYWSEGRDLVERVLIGRGGPGGTVVEPCGFMPQGATCRLRQNVAEVRAKGLEIEQSLRLAAHWRVELFGTLLDSVLTENPANTELVGNHVLRTPEQAGTLSLTYENPRTLSAVLRATYSGDRWNDIENTEPLEDHLLVDVSLQRALGAHFTAFAGVSNLLDEAYTVNYSDDGSELGAPRIAHVGLRFTTRSEER